MASWSSQSSLLASIRAVMLDLSGTLHIEDVCMPKAVEAIEKLQDLHIPYKLVTNTTKESTRRLHQRLSSIGFNVDQSSIFSSLTAASKYCRERELSKPLLLLTPGAKEEFESFVNIDQDDEDIGFEEYDSVVIGLSRPDFNYSKLNKAFAILKEKPTAPLVAIHKSKYFETQNGLSVGPGCFVVGLEYSSGKEAVVVGKPMKSFFDDALNSINEQHHSDIKPNETLMVGDDVEMDVLGAQDSGFKGCLVRTGKYRAGDEHRRPSMDVDLVFDNVYDLVQALEDAKRTL